MDKKEFSNTVLQMDESMREIAALDELYEELLKSRPEDEKELTSKLDEAKFARDRLLRLSLHVKHLLARAESAETLR